MNIICLEGREMPTLYQLADQEIRACISDYLELADQTNGLSSVSVGAVNSDRKAVILLAGLNVHGGKTTAERSVDEWSRRRAVPFDIETGITAGVYNNIRNAGKGFFEEVRVATKDFNEWEPAYINANPHVLPILQHLSGIFSKAALRKQVGNVSDNSISMPAAERLSTLLKDRVDANTVRKAEILKRLDSTLEGIVRDLVGRVMLESIVESVLAKEKVPFKREEEYSSLSGVVYDFRADFVVPDEKTPVAFIEVRKSSSRHASLYAKDKMFSAINWKGKHPKMLAILVVDGEWTAETLKVMAQVFDYVVPLRNVNDVARTISEYLAGDESKRRWLIEFSIVPT